MLERFYVIIAVVFAVVISHLIKESIHVIREGNWDWYVLLWQTGGMPSSHSAGVAALATAVFLQEGLSTVFYVSLVLAVVVIRDAFGVRKSVSDQAKILNVLVSKAKVQKKVKVVLGHTPAQTSMGALVGIASAVGLWFLV